MKIIINLGKRSQLWNSKSRILGHAVMAALEATARADELFIKLHNVPDLYEAGVVYREEPEGSIEEFATIPVIYERGWGDCDDLAPARVAFLRSCGEKADIRLQWKKSRRSGRRLYHVTVRREDGRIEDPSRILGMK